MKWRVHERDPETICTLSLDEFANAIAIIITHSCWYHQDQHLDASCGYLLSSNIRCDGVANLEGLISGKGCTDNSNDRVITFFLQIICVFYVNHVTLGRAFSLMSFIFYIEKIRGRAWVPRGREENQTWRCWARFLTRYNYIASHICIMNFIF
jgi:hypothetical protein